MNHDANNLLNDVLAEAAPADLRDAMLAETLRFVRRRRQIRRVRPAAGVLALTSLLVILITQRSAKPPLVSTPPTKQVEQQSYTLIRTQPFAASALVSTKGFSATGLAASVPKVVEVATISGGFRLINDDELLSLLADKPAVLIRTGPHSEELVFANPEDQNGFPLN